MKYGFEELGLDRIISITIPEHVVSQRVMRKCGLTYQGTITLDDPRTRMKRNVVWYAIDRSRWESQKRASRELQVDTRRFTLEDRTAAHGSPCCGVVHSSDAKGQSINASRRWLFMVGISPACHRCGAAPENLPALEGGVATPAGHAARPRCRRTCGGDHRLRRTAVDLRARIPPPRLTAPAPVVAAHLTDKARTAANTSACPDAFMVFPKHPHPHGEISRWTDPRTRRQPDCRVSLGFDRFPGLRAACRGS